VFVREKESDCIQRNFWLWRPSLLTGRGVLLGAAASLRGETLSPLEPGDETLFAPLRELLASATRVPAADLARDLDADLETLQIPAPLAAEIRKIVLGAGRQPIDVQVRVVAVWSGGESAVLCNRPSDGRAAYGASADA
jgi:hypothetical protein